MDVEFVAAADGLATCPRLGLPEVALAGRSNVGKSSLINVLVDRKALVRTSKDPGRTRMLGFIRVERRVVLVDLPGYGYAKVAQSERGRWADMVDNYLAQRCELALVLLLIDCRRDPGEAEFDFVEWLRGHDRPVTVVATKIDKLSRAQRSTRIQRIAQALGTSACDVIPFSAVTKEGRRELWARIEMLRRAGLPSEPVP
ncbi:MAG: YihA family ribosome biogenesis GTP-binding protein [Deltaproteobacteria bacterium]|jgi:GTP-binding protein|nr:YihA family ribosome biogenesis GTP-binding protein [Deltaproteobacteria bacterium]